MSNLSQINVRIPDDLRTAAAHAAAVGGLSMAELVRRGVAAESARIIALHQGTTLDAELGTAVAAVLIAAREAIRDDVIRQLVANINDC